MAERNGVLRGSMSRRSFVRTAGLAAGGFALGTPLLGCADYTVALPCLGPAAAPDPVPGMTYIWASKIGCALDCHLENGHNKQTGGHATDDGPRINEAMASASADHPITLIIDGGALISGLFLPAGGHWAIAGLGCGTGFFLKRGTNNDGIHNGPPSAGSPADPGPPAPPRGQNVSLSNFTLNGNRGDGHSGVSTNGDARGGKTDWFIGINLMNLDHITVEKLVIVNSPSYSMRFSNVGHVDVSGCVLHSRGTNTDGLHFNGPANDITIANCDIQTDDDSIALNCPEGYSGDIARVLVTDCTFDSWSLMRLYTANAGSNKFIIDTVSVKNCTGTFSETAFYFGLGYSSNPDSISSLTVSDCNLTGPAVLGVSENFGNIKLQNVVYTPKPSRIEPKRYPFCAFLRPAPYILEATVKGSSLTFENCAIHLESETKVVAAVLENGSSIANLRLNGFAVVQPAGKPPLPALIEIGSGSVGQLVVDSVTSNNIGSVASAGAFDRIGTVYGAGVLASGWEFPDAVMANDVPYISAATGLPSIKVNGVVERYVAP